ncbi:sigma-70 family RNA polymerase sigma factor [Rossellomorea marisflavi]|uniref:sigma-70 family RNA polymerase sigma factor n=1 Tax=Rossellomorea marisflavi TaxID=189381 RepID=UPI0034599F86
MSNSVNSDGQVKKYEDYISRNKDFFNNNLIKTFLEIKDNEALLKEIICNPVEDNKKLLDSKFKSFYFNIKFTSYISSALYFNAINFDKKHRKTQKRNPLTVDQPLGDSESSTFKDQIRDDSAEIKLDSIIQSENIFDYIEDPKLYEAVKILTKKQLEILNLAYINGFSNTEIALILDRSQQTISKTHKKALENIYNFMVERV